MKKKAKNTVTRIVEKDRIRSAFTATIESPRRKRSITKGRYKKRWPLELKIDYINGKLNALKKSQEKNIVEVEGLKKSLSTWDGVSGHEVTTRFSSCCRREQIKKENLEKYKLTSGKNLGTP